MQDLMLLAHTIVEDRRREAERNAWRWRLRETLIEAAARESRPQRETPRPARSAAVIRCCGVGA